MTPRQRTIERLSATYLEALALLELARARQNRRMQRLRLRAVDRAWAALYAVAGRRWRDYGRPR